MAGGHKSDWRILHGATVLLDFDDLIPSEPDMSWGKVTQVEPLVDGAHPFINAKKNVQNDLSFSRVKKLSSMAEARNWRLSHSIECANLGKDTVTIQLRGGAEYRLLNAVVISGSSASGISLSAHPERAQMSYEIIGGKLEVVTGS